MEWTHVEGKDAGNVKLYALSTCIHCKKTKEFLKNSGVAFDFVFVDLLEEKELSEVYGDVKKFNPAGSFPTIVINGDNVIVGSKLNEISEALCL